MSPIQVKKVKKKKKIVVSAWLYIVFSILELSAPFFVLPVCFSSSHVFGPAKENTGHVAQQEILPHLVLVQNINMKK